MQHATVHARAQPSGDTMAHDPQGHQQQAVGIRRDNGVDTCDAGERRGQARQDEQLSNVDTTHGHSERSICHATVTPGGFHVFNKLNIRED